MSKTIFLASDHAGYNLRNILAEYLESLWYEVNDLGPLYHNPEDDYVDYAIRLCEKVLEKDARGILVCGTGQGMDRAANKFPGIYASVCWDELSAKVAKEHANVNVLCLGERSLDERLAKKIVDIWLTSKFKGERHQRRLDKIKEIEKRYMK